MCGTCIYMLDSLSIATSKYENNTFVSLCFGEMPSSCFRIPFPTRRWLAPSSNWCILFSIRIYSLTCCTWDILTLAIRGGLVSCHPQTVFARLLENAYGWEAEIWAVYSSKPDLGAPELFSGQVRSLTCDVILWPLHGQKTENYLPLSTRDGPMEGDTFSVWLSYEHLHIVCILRIFTFGH